MSREVGTFNFAANFEVLKKAPLDAKQLVTGYSALTATTTWNASGNVWLYDGAIVSVRNDADSNKNGIYYLCDSTNYNLTCSWIKAGTGVGAGTVTGATNGIILVNSGTTVVLGGSLTGNTYINIDLGNLTITGGTGFGIDIGASALSFGDYNATGCSSYITISDNVTCIHQGDDSFYYGNIRLDDNGIAQISAMANSGASFSQVVADCDGVRISANCGADNAAIQIGNGEIYVCGSCTGGFVGMQYCDDYSTNYTDRSLVDKTYVNAVAIGLQPKTAVWVATTSGITLSGSPQTIDGVSVTNGQRILVKNQSGTTAAVDNGIYIVTGGTWQRSPDFNGSPQGEITQGALIPVISGITLYNTLWVLITSDPITGGTTPLSFTYFSRPTSLIEGVGIDISGNTISVDGASLVGNSMCWDGSQLGVDESTGTLSTALSNKLNVSIFSGYTGTTQPIINAAITGITYAGTGTTLYSGTTGLSGRTIILNTIIGSGSTSVQKIGNEIVIYSSGGSEVYNFASPSICPAGGMCIGTVLTGKTALKLLQEILVPELCGTLTDPSFSTTLVASTTYYEIGCNIPTLSVCGTFNRGCINPQYYSTSDKRVGYATCYVYTGAQVAGTYTCSGCSISKSVTGYTVIATPEIWNITVCYGAGVQPLGQYGTPFNSACPANSLSNSKTICGVYPIFATTSAIGTLTKQGYVAMTTTPVQLVLVAEGSSLKDRFEIPNAWTGNPLKCICTYNTFSGLWEWEGGSGAASLTTWTPSVSSETLCCGSAPYCLYTYNGACRLTTTCIRLVF
jgi:hypothetical protein